MSQEALAGAAGYHRNYIGQLERAEKSPSLTALFILARVLNTQPSVILRKIEKGMGVPKLGTSTA
jgi:transcriptional regulator with XRE-family HTH domain